MEITALLRTHRWYLSDRLNDCYIDVFILASKAAKLEIEVTGKADARRTSQFSGVEEWASPVRVDL